jgi:hypothetical protein
MSREERERELKLIARQPDGVAKLCDLYRSLTQQLPPVGASSGQLIKSILAAESQPQGAVAASQ